MTQKYRTLIVPEDEQLPPLSTELPGRSYSFASFIVEWVLSSKDMRQDENLEHLFEVQQAIEAAQKPGEAFKVSEEAYQTAKVSAKAGIDEAMTPNAIGRVALVYPWSTHILRHYHKLTKAE